MKTTLAMGDDGFEVPLTHEERALIEKAAKDSGMTTVAWCVLALEAAENIDYLCCLGDMESISLPIKPGEVAKLTEPDEAMRAWARATLVTAARLEL